MRAKQPAEPFLYQKVDSNQITAMNNNFEFLDITIESASEDDAIGPSSRFTLALTGSGNTPLDPFCGVCVVLDFSKRGSAVDGAVLASELQHLEKTIAATGGRSLESIQRFLIKTGGQTAVTEVKWASCLKILQERGAVLLGTDTPLNDELANSKMCTLVNLKLSSVVGGTVGVLVSGPEKISGAALVPCRSVLVSP